MKKLVLLVLLSIFLSSAFQADNARPAQVNIAAGRPHVVIKYSAKHAHIKRDSKAKRQFMKQTGYPKGRRGYVVDHIIPLKRGGTDTPDNMQWQTIEEAKEKDRWE